MTKYDYDLFTIGGGSGGVRATRLAATYGARAALAEEYRVGGTCVIRGCIPKKLFVYASEFSHAFKDAAGYGWNVENASFDWGKLIENKDAEIDRLNGIYIRNLKNAGADVIQSRAIVKDAHTVHLVAEGRDVTAERILIATGGAPWTDESIDGAELGVTSNEAFHLPNLPRRVIIAGGGYIAVEFACIFRGLGCDVALVYRGEDILRYFDRDVSVQVHREMQQKGVRIVTQAVFTKIEALDDGDKRVHLSTGVRLDADLVLWAVGRRPATKGLGLEGAGVKLDKNGAVMVDGWSKSSVPSIYAVGDVTDRINLTPVAIREGAAFAETCFNDNPMKTDYRCVPSAVFSQPEAATVGYAEHDARREFAKIDIYKTDFRPLKNTLSQNAERMMMKLVVDADTERVVGCHIVGHGAAEMIQCLAVAVKAGLTKKQFDETVALHPTSAEEIVLLREKFAPPVEGNALA